MVRGKCHKVIYAAMYGIDTMSGPQAFFHREGGVSLVNGRVYLGDGPEESRFISL